MMYRNERERELGYFKLKLRLDRDVRHWGQLRSYSINERYDFIECKAHSYIKYSDVDEEPDAQKQLKRITPNIILFLQFQPSSNLLLMLAI